MLAATVPDGLLTGLVLLGIGTLVGALGYTIKQGINLVRLTGVIEARLDAHEVRLSLLEER